MIELVEIKDAEWPLEDNGLLKLNGVAVEAGKCEVRVLGGFFNLFIHDLELSEAILAHRFSDLPDRLMALTIPQDKVIDDPSVLESIRVQEVKRVFTEFDITFDFENWKKTWSAADYGRVLQEHLNETQFQGVELNLRTSRLFSDGFTILAQVPSMSLSIGSEVSRLLEAVTQLHNAATTSLSAQLGSTITFIATAQNGSGTNISSTVVFQSSDTSILDIAPGGVAGAGKWNGPAFTVCTPAGIGMVQVTASADGAVSAPTLVFVHPHIDNIAVHTQATDADRMVEDMDDAVQRKLMASQAEGGMQ